MLGERALDQVPVDDIARAAGISRGLLFHYFPTKRDFHVAVAQRAADRLLEVTTPDPSVDELTRLRVALDAFVRYIEQNRASYLALVRGAAGADPLLAEVHESTRLRIVERVLGQLDVAEPPALLRLAVRGWVAMVEEVTVAWLDGWEPGRDALIAMFERALRELVALASARPGEAHPQAQAHAPDQPPQPQSKAQAQPPRQARPRRPARRSPAAPA